jgi:hypothetical protein
VPLLRCPCGAPSHARQIARWTSVAQRRLAGQQPTRLAQACASSPTQLAVLLFCPGSVLNQSPARSPVVRRSLLPPPNCLSRRPSAALRRCFLVLLVSSCASRCSPCCQASPALLTPLAPCLIRWLACRTPKLAFSWLVPSRVPFLQFPPVLRLLHPANPSPSPRLIDHPPLSSLACSPSLGARSARPS